MPDIRLRPRFRQDLDCSPRVVLRTLSDALAHPDTRITGSIFESSAILKVPTDDLHFWSPQLQVSVEPRDGGSTVHGLFGPHPTIWSLFIVLYVAIGFAATMGGAIGAAQWTLDRFPWTLWSIPVGIVLASVVWVVGRTGRRLGYGQTRMLYDFLQERLDECELTGPGT